MNSKEYDGDEPENCFNYSLEDFQAVANEYEAKTESLNESLDSFHEDRLQTQTGIFNDAYWGGLNYFNLHKKLNKISNIL